MIEKVCSICNNKFEAYNKVMKVCKDKECRRKDALRKYYAIPVEERQRRALYYNRKNPNQYLYETIRASAHAAGYETDLVVEDIVIPEYCPYLKEPLDLVRSKSLLAPSIDRIDSEGKYMKGNIQIISKLANWMKSKATVGQQITFAQSILDKHNF
jgi:hypothetical protein